MSNSVYLVNKIVNGKSDHPINTLVFRDARSAVVEAYSMIVTIGYFTLNDMENLISTQMSILEATGCIVVTCHAENVLINKAEVS